jgi:hypothetical protein
MPFEELVRGLATQDGEGNVDDDGSVGAVVT